jgi:hypothetical protein
LVIASSGAAVALSDRKLSEGPRTERLAVAVPNSPNSTAPKSILANLKEAKATSFSQRFHFTKKGRVVYHHQFQAGDQNISLKLSGPFAKKKPGLGIKVMGLVLGGHPVEIRGYGNTKKQAINFKIRF